MEEIAIDKIDLLLVDDRPDNLITLEAVLSSPRYHLIKANSGDEALRYLLDHSPAVILMDVQMPGLDGFETASIIKGSKRTREIPIIFITAISKDDRFVHQGYDHGAVDYIYKPYDPHILKSKIAVFVELAQKTKQLLLNEKLLRENENRENERQLAQLELRNLKREQADQKKYRDLVNGIYNGIVWTAEPDSLVISFISPSAKKILGYSFKDYFSDINFLKTHIHPEDLQRFMEAVHQIQVNKTAISVEHRVISAQNTEIWLQTELRLAQRADNSGDELRGLSIDVTKMKNTEEALRQNNQRTAFLAESSLLLSESFDYTKTFSKIGALAVSHFADWFFVDVIDENGEIKQLTSVENPIKPKSASQKSLHKMRATAGCLSVKHVIASKKAELYSHVTKEALKECSENNQHFETLKKLDLKSVMIAPMIARGRTLGAMTFISYTDERIYTEDELHMVTDLGHRCAIAMDNANLYEQAQAAIHARDEFLSIASHELKTPLTPLKLQTQSLLRLLSPELTQIVNPEKLKQMVQTSERQISRLSRLIEDLLDISRLSDGRLTLNLEEFNLVELIHEVIERHGSQMLNAKCSIEFLETEPLYVHWDRFRIEQIITNLLTNAFKYGAGKPIRIVIKKIAEKVHISFEDQGIGIAKEDQARIFNRYERAVSSTHFGGLGLGLYIVSQILTAHGGKIAVKSEVGQGSIFTVELPSDASSIKIPQKGSAA